MKKLKHKGKIITGASLLAVSSVLQMAARNSTGFASWYTGTIYPFWVNLFGRFWSVAPFSAVEMLLYGLILALIFQMAVGIRNLIKKKKTFREAAGNGGASLLALAGVLFFLYTAMCGINYHSDSFSSLAGLEVKEYTVAQLAEYCRVLTEQVNELSGKTDRTKFAGTEKTAVRAMENLGKKYEPLSGYYPNPKPVTFSQILSFQHLTGVYSPFTVEANYNSDMTAYNIPFTMCHELSHLRGFMREDEANYIAYLACVNSDNTEFQYSGTLLAWLYSTNLLYGYDRETYRELSAQLETEVRRDLAENTAFWDRYEGKISEVSDKVNDTYLKANRQTDGVESYDRMVDLLMAAYLS